MIRAWTAVFLTLTGVFGVASADDNRLSAGDSVTLDEYVPGNAFLAGGRISLDDRVGGSAFVSGGEVDVAGSVGRNLYAAGGDLRIGGEVEGSVHAAGGKVRVARGARLRKDVSLAGGSVEVEGDVGDDLEVYGESIVINGVIGGDLRIAGEDIRIGPDTRVAGRLEYKTGGTFVIDQKARVVKGIEQRDANDHHWLRNFGRGDTHVGGGLFRIGVLLLGVLMILGLPAFSREAAAMIRREWWQSAAVGCAVLVGVPFAAVILMITLIGIPLALMMIFGYVVLLMLGYAIGALFVGDLALERLGGDRIKSLGWRLLFLLLAVIVLSVVRQLPLIGGLVVALLFVAGVGAFAIRSWKEFRRKGDAVPS